MATLQMKIDSVHAEFLSGNAVSTTVTYNSVVSRDSNGGIWATKLTSLNLGLTHNVPTTDRTGDTVFYSSDGDTIYKNTAAGMRESLNFENSAMIPANSSNEASNIVVRDTNGDFSAGVITADLSGNASTAADADKLDGIEASQFLRSDTSDTVAAGVTYNWSATNTHGLEFNNSSYTGNVLRIGGWTTSNDNNISRIRNSTGNLHIDSAANGNLYLNHYSGGVVYVDSTLNSDAITASGQIYTSNAFYTDGNRSVIRGGSPTLYFRDTDHYSAMIHNNGNLLYVLRGANDTETWTQVNGVWPWIWNLTNNDSTCGGSLYCYGNVTAYSDIRHKTDIVKLDDCLEKVEKLNGYTYTRKNDGKRYTGLIAQEVLEVLPEAVSTDEKGEYALAYGNLAGLFVEAMKEMKSRIDALEKKLEA